MELDLLRPTLEQAVEHQRLPLGLELQAPLGLVLHHLELEHQRPPQELEHQRLPLRIGQHQHHHHPPELELEHHRLPLGIGLHQHHHHQVNQ